MLGMANKGVSKSSDGVFRDTLPPILIHGYQRF